MKETTPKKRRRPRLGKLKRTDRGFQVIDFADYYGKPCTLQQSSLAKFTQPGASAVWLGTNTERMHLDLRQVKALHRHLENWIATGHFNEK